MFYVWPNTDKKSCFQWFPNGISEFVIFWEMLKKHWLQTYPVVEGEY